MNQIPDNVEQGDVALLNAVNAEAGDGETILGHFTDATAVFAGEGDGQQTFFSGRL